jgi:hypothetical protein
VASAKWEVLVSKGTDPAVAKLERIQQLWHRLQREIPESPGYKELTDQIRVLSAEYVELIDAAKKLKESN